MSENQTVEELPALDDDSTDQEEFIGEEVEYDLGSDDEEEAS